MIWLIAILLGLILAALIDKDFALFVLWIAGALMGIAACGVAALFGLGLILAS